MDRNSLFDLDPIGILTEIVSISAEINIDRVSYRQNYVFRGNFQAIYGAVW